MSRPTVEITEEMEAWARRAQHSTAGYVGVKTSEIATAILAAIPQPLRPLAVGDVVDRYESNGRVHAAAYSEPHYTVRGLFDGHAAMRGGDGGPWWITDLPVYRVGESEPAPWPWEVAP